MQDGQLTRSEAIIAFREIGTQTDLHTRTRTHASVAESCPGPFKSALARPLLPLYRPTLLLYHICAGTGLIPATSAPDLGSPLPHLHRHWARPRHICTGTVLVPATSAPALGSPPPDPQ